MLAETTFSENFQTNPLYFPQMDLETVRLNRGGSSFGATPLPLNDNLVRSYYTTLRALGFKHGGKGISLENFENNLCLVFKLRAAYHIVNNTMCPEITGARLGVELKLSTATKNPIWLFLLGEEKFVVLTDRNREDTKNPII